MATTHRLHRVHTGRIESGAVAVASEKACSSCLEPLSQLEKPAFHCNQCDYTVCGACDKPKSHPVHPNHGVFYITPISPWRCDVCKLSSENIQEIQCYHCEQCGFRICKKCYAGVTSPLHVHDLYRIDASYVYHQSNGQWICSVCDNNNGPGHIFPAHCSSCQFDLCDNCIKPYRSTFHPAHVLYKADSNLVYPGFNGGWRCDRCSRSFIPQFNNFPFHCSQCEFDLCDSCMKTTGDVSNADDEEAKEMDYSNMTLEEKRLYYRCGNNYVTLDQVLPWRDYVKENHRFFTRKGWLHKDSEFTTDNDHINRKVSLWLGDITQLEIDAIVHDATDFFFGGVRVDYDFHQAAGEGLLEECRKLKRCPIGDAKITSGYKLPAKHVIHAVGPLVESHLGLYVTSYNSCLRLVKEHELSSVAFFGNSAGIYFGEDQ